MKYKIHPVCQKIQAKCSCGNIINMFSILKSNINLDVCSNCHPFYTGKQKLTDNKGRVNLFNKRYLTKIKN